ncbi:hypothetical protein [Micromonospora sp. CPCC 206061]|uniref:hypothetical protein n=1 Tax=Micromonospora sp. CPCC 206061 TaxID=3122410 RepID=UPI002FEF48AB
MKSWVRKSLSVGVLAAGALLIGQSAAQAAPDIIASSGPNIGTGNGLQTITPVTTVTNVQCAAPVVTGLGLFDCSGGASAGSDGSHKPTWDENSYKAWDDKKDDKKSPKKAKYYDDGHGGSDDGHGGSDDGHGGSDDGHGSWDWDDAPDIIASSGPNIGTLNGTQVIAPVTTVTNAQCAAPVVTGLGLFDCSGGASAESARVEGKRGWGGGDAPDIIASTGPNIGTGNGIQTIAPVTTVTNAQCAAPIVTGLGLFDCSGGASAESARVEGKRGWGGGDAPDIIASTGPNIGTGNGIQTIAPVTTVTNAQCAAPIVTGLGLFDCSGGATAESASVARREALPLVGSLFRAADTDTNAHANADADGSAGYYGDHGDHAGTRSGAGMKAGV